VEGSATLLSTKFGSLSEYTKGSIEIIDDDPKHYAFSNMYEVATQSRPYEKVIVGMNRQYTLEAIRAEGTSEWRTAPHDEFALVMDGEVTIRLFKLDDPRRYHDPEASGSRAIDGDPAGEPMGAIIAKKGHMAPRTPPTNSIRISPAWCCCRRSRAPTASSDGPTSVSPLSE
jgi:hypothetical protein